MTTVRADDQIGVNLNRSIRSCRLDSDDASVCLQQVDHFRLCLHFESRIARAMFVDEIQKVPLRHEGDEFAVRRQMRKVRERDEVLANLSAQLTHFLMRPLEKILEEAQLMHQLERRRMNCVAAKVAQKIRVLLKHDDLDARTRQQKPEHHSGRATAHDATASLHAFQGVLRVISHGLRQIVSTDKETWFLLVKPEKYRSPRRSSLAV